METSHKSQAQTKLSVCLFSDSNFLALNVLETLLSKNCYVYVITKDGKNWKNKTSRINPALFTVIDKPEQIQQLNYGYALFFSGFLNKEKFWEEYNTFSKLTISPNVKTITLFPFEIFSQELANKIENNGNSATIFVGDLLGPRFDFDSNLFVSDRLNEILGKREIILGVGEVFYPLFVSDVAKTISKWLFSFGPYGKEIFLLGQQTSASFFWKVNEKLVPGVKIEYDNDIPVRSIPKNYEIKYLDADLNFLLTETYKWFNKLTAPRVIQKPVKKEEVKPIAETVKEEKLRKPLTARQRMFRSIMSGLVFFLLIPFITLLISGTLSYFSYRSFMAGDTKNTENTLLIAKSFFVIGREESRLLQNIPLLGRPYKESFYLSDLGQKGVDTVVAGMPMVKDFNEMFGNILGDTPYDPSSKTSEIKGTLEFVYQNLAFIQLETITAQKDGLLSARYVSSKINFDKYKNLLTNGSILLDNLPSLLGKDKTKAYLVLFQNNMELRPTGGFIGSFGVMNMDGGRLAALNINDVYSADGQLRGHVEPPAPIKNYLGEANWWLRDSNWDPDFPTSAQRAEWFLDKEMDQKVDGVIGVDLHLIQDVLKSTGPVFLPDYNLEISDQNLYEKTQEEVQSNFFPGTHKKASFLTALSRQLLDSVGKMDSSKKIHILKSVFANLEGRHIQSYLHDQAMENAVSGMGWGGIVAQPVCGDSCYPDFTGIVEANVGVNKANYFINRSASLNVNISKDEITRSLVITYKNTANPALGPAGKYKVYVRALIPSDAQLAGVKSYIGGTEEVLSPEIVTLRDRKEIGVLLEVLPSQEEKLQFVWQSPVDAGQLASYGLYVRKQAGVGEDPWAYTIESGVGKLSSSPSFTLTSEGVYKYNSNLDQDFFSKFSW